MATSGFAYRLAHMSHRLRKSRDPREEEQPAPVQPRAAAVPEVAGAAPDRQQGALATVHPGVGAQMVLQMQQAQGNAYVSRMVGGPTIARRKPPTIREDVGAEAGTMTFLEGAGDVENVVAGERGYTKRMLEAMPDKAAETVGLYEDYHLTPVKVPFNTLDRQMEICAEEQRKAQDKVDTAEGEGIFEGRQVPTVIRLAKERRDGWKRRTESLASDRELEHRLSTSFNTGVPRANQTFLSLAGLEGMEQMLGIKDPKAMTASIVKSLKEATDVADVAQFKGGVSAMEPLKATESVTTSAQEVTDSQMAMQSAWLAVQQELIKDHIGGIEKRGEADRERLGKIKETIDFCRQVGSAIDVSMTVMSGAKTMIEGTSTKLKPSEVGDLLAEDSPSVRDKSAITGAKKIGGAIAESMDIKIPTSAAGLLEAGAKLYHWSELEGIRKRLAELENQTTAFKQVADEIGVLKKFRDFDAAAARYGTSLKKLQEHLHDRRVAYLKMGEQLDAAARSQSKGKLGKGSERFATVMTLTGQVREVLAIADGAKKGFRAAELDYVTLRETLGGIAERREFIPGELPAEEAEALLSMQNQVKMFEAFTAQLGEFLGPIEEQAKLMMASMSLGGGDASAEH